MIRASFEFIVVRIIESCRFKNHAAVCRKSVECGKSRRMRCPFCKRDNDRVTDSRASDEGYAIRRRRECLSCKRRYTTYERLEEDVIKVVKKDGAREPFNREKIRQGLERACWKRAVPSEQLEKIVVEVENEVLTSFETEIESRRLGEMVMERLALVDQVAYVRFASVYREFKDASDFVQELQPMLRDARQK